MNPKVLIFIPERDGAELPGFARWFSQDWDLMWESLDALAVSYFDSLSRERRIKLSAEISDFLSRYEGRDTELERAWIEMGGEAWDDQEGLRPMLTRYIDSSGRPA
jgi:hypothetical protein